MGWTTATANPRPPEPPVVAVPIPNRYTAAAKIAGWPWPALASRSEEGRHKFFSIAFRYMLLISVPMFALMLTLAIGYEVSILGLLIVVPLALVSAVAMGLGQVWIVDNAYREGKSKGLLWWTPFYLQYYILTRWAICWRPMGMIAVGGAFYVSLLFYLMGDQLGTSSANNNRMAAIPKVPQQVRPFDRIRSSSARRSTPRSNTTTETWYNGIQPQPSPAAPANETVWSYESLAAGPSETLPSTNPNSAEDNAIAVVPAQPVLSPVFEEEDGFREWSNLTGSYKVVAKIDVVEGEFLRLKTREGRKIQVEIAKLSAEDRRFLEPILKSNPFEEVGAR